MCFMCALRYCVEVRDAKSDDTKCLTINPYQKTKFGKKRENWVVGKILSLCFFKKRAAWGRKFCSATTFGREIWLVETNPSWIFFFFFRLTLTLIQIFHPSPSLYLDSLSLFSLLFSFPLFCLVWIFEQQQQKK